MGSAFCYIIDQFLHYGFLLHLFCYIMGHFASLLHYGFLLHYRLLQGRHTTHKHGPRKGVGGFDNEHFEP